MDFKRLSRRRLLDGGFATSAALLIAGKVAAQGHNHHGMSGTLGQVQRPKPPTMDQPLVEPEVRRSANGVLQTSLRCAYTFAPMKAARPVRPCA